MGHSPFALPAALLALALAPAVAVAQALPDKEATFGAFASPAALPPGSTAAYGYAGVPEVGGGYRMGVGGLEIDARLRFNYFSLALALEGHAKYPVLTTAELQLAPSLGVGLVGNTGSRYIDRENFRYLGARVIPGAQLSYRIAETANLLGEASVPVDFSLSPTGGYRVTPLVGGGGELYLGEDITAGAVALFGADVIKEPLGRARGRFAFSLRVGVGFRFF